MKRKFYYPPIYRKMGLSKKGFICFVRDYITKNHPGHKVIRIDGIYAYCVEKEKEGEKEDGLH